MSDNPFSINTYDYELPSTLIAKHPCPQKEQAKLMHVNALTGNITHHCFKDLHKLLPPQSCITLNNTKVYPVRLYLETHKRIHEFVITQINKNNENQIISLEGQLRHRKKLSLNEMLCLEKSPQVKLLFSGPAPFDSSLSSLKPASPLSYTQWINIIEMYGEMPLPPYINRTYAPHQDISDYQTVYAHHGFSVAAPTAGLHFSEASLGELSELGFHLTFLTLDVGYATFKMMDQTDIRDHAMHHEQYSITRSTWNTVQNKKHVVAIGTTSCRALESFSKLSEPNFDTWHQTNLFITPGYEFKNVTHLLTNFHLPRSSLLCLAFAFGGIDLMKSAYQSAIENNYRFFSYGDAMLITRI
jgi:S-adenosylmethionine:tRNA ribosyltransferase-isomerase